MDKTKPSPTGTSGKETAEARAEREHIDAALDEALEETFPASDPVAIAVTTIARPLSRK